MGSASKTHCQDWRMVEVRTGAGMPDRPDRPTSSKLHYTVLVFLDTIFSATVAAPAVVGYWRGTWCLSDAYICPGREVFSSMASVVIGLSGLFAFSLSQNFLDEILDPDKHRLLYYIGSRFYTAVFGFCCVSAWRGTWQALDHFTELTAYTVSATTLASVFLLTVMKTLRNIAAPPFAISLDSCKGYFAVPTRFRVDGTKDWSLYILDCAFSVGVVGTLVVFVWRGAWVLFDLYLFPECREHSAVGSLILGYIIVTMTFCLQPLVRYACARLQGLSRLVMADSFIVLGFLGTVNVWRGIWNLLDLWLFPENPKLSCWVTHVGCFILLVLLNCSNSILVRGIYIDAEEDDGRCVAFPCHYLRVFFKVEREKKEARRRNLLVASKEFSSHADENEKNAESGTLLNSTLPSIIPANPESLA